MDHRARCLHFLDRYAAKDLAALLPMLAPEVHVRDWHLSLHGITEAEAFLRRNFEQARSLAIEVLHLHASGDTVVAEVRVVVDGDTELHLVDVMQFDAQGRVLSLRSYLGRGD